MTNPFAYALMIYYSTYLEVIIMGLMSQSLSIDSKSCHTPAFIIHNNDTFTRHGNVFW